MPLVIRRGKWKFVATISTFLDVWQVARRGKSTIKFNAFNFRDTRNTMYVAESPFTRRRRTTTTRCGKSKFKFSAFTLRRTQCYAAKSPFPWCRGTRRRRKFKIKFNAFTFCDVWQGDVGEVNVPFADVVSGITIVPIYCSVNINIYSLLLSLNSKKMF